MTEIREREARALRPALFAAANVASAEPEAILTARRAPRKHPGYR
jgi:hypothetical protein